ncbi:MAG: helix-turn-helix domain-containing protein [Lachnospiraceae bacterium]|nr:helix-turn-helix domain-containing protein [Lachnospiraceae bacterium]
MEDNILSVSGPAEVAAHVNMSEMYLQRGFQVVTGMTLGEYVRNRRLYLAAMDLVGTDGKIIDISYKYGYDTPESFTKAFGRFHDATPTQIRRNECHPKTFLPLTVSMVVKGGSRVDVTFEKPGSFKLIGKTWDMPFEQHLGKIPGYLDDFENRFKDLLQEPVMPSGLDRYGRAVYENRIGEYDALTCLDVPEGWCRFMIAGAYNGKDVPNGMEIWTIPEAEWAVFRCEGPLHNSVDNIKKYIWYEWLPGNGEYELSGDYYITRYNISGRFTDIDYRCEMWMPVKRKKMTTGER